MKKCPLLKEIHYETTNGLFLSETCGVDSIEKFQNCIGEECMAWCENQKTCIYFIGMRSIYTQKIK